jgi:glycosyltransferase involved in cell wall biosynthesis
MDDTAANCRILFITPGYPPHSTGGVARHVQSLATALREKFAVSIVSRDAPSDMPEETANLFRLPPSPDRGSVDGLVALRDPAFERSLLEIVDKVRPDLVHVHHWLYLSNYLVQLLRARDLPVVVTLHDHFAICAGNHLIDSRGASCAGPKAGLACAECLPPPGAAFAGENSGQRLLRRIRRLISGVAVLPAYLKSASARLFCSRLENIHQELLSADAIIGPSRHLKEAIASVWPDLEEKISVLSHGIETGWRESVHRTPSDKIRFSYTGVLAPHKGIDLLLQAYASLDRNKSALTIYGGSDDAAYLRRIEGLAADCGAVLAGKYSASDLPAIYRDTDIAIAPSICLESAGLTVLEAFVGGAPVIAANTGGLAEAVVDGKTGLLFQRGDVSDLAKKMNRFIREPQLLGELRKNLSLPKSIEQYAAELAEVYESARAQSDAERSAKQSPPSANPSD